MAWKGTYNAGVLYATGDTVGYAGTVWVAVTGNAGQLPTPGAYWTPQNVLDQPGSVIAGVTVTGTPVAGQALTALTASTADWQTPATGVTLDTTAGDIAALGAQAAGAVGKAADAGHVHPTTGVLLSGATAGGVLSGTYPNPGITTLNQDTSGNAATATTAGNVTGTVAIGNGGTGQTTAPLARAALNQPMLGTCQAVATANITLSGTQTIDGYAAAAGDLILAAGQTTASQNGPWTVASGAWTRPGDFASAAVVKGRAVQVSGGTVYANSVWSLSSTASVTVDTTSQTWVPVAAAPNVQWFNSTPGTYTWTKPTGAQLVYVLAISGGGQGGSGAAGTSVAARTGGGGGGSGGVMFATFPAADITSPVTVTVGAGGSGGAAPVTGTNPGNGGTAGGSSSFGAYLVASRGFGGGAGGAGAAATSGVAGAGYGGSLGLGAVSSATGLAGTGGGVAPTGGGGSGGGIVITTPAAVNGGTGGASLLGAGTSSSAGVVDSTAPGTGSAVTVRGQAGAGGGGGASSLTTNAQNGATAAGYGGGGGGGGAAPVFTYTATNASPCVFTATGSAYANGGIVQLSGTTYSYTATNAPSTGCVFTAAGSAYANGTEVELSNTGLPAGFTAFTPYYVVGASGTTFQLALAPAGAAINSTSTGTGGTVISGTGQPTGFSPFTSYYIVNVSGATFQLAATSGGAAINSSSTGAGTVGAFSGAGGAGGQGYVLVVTYFQ